MTIEICSNQDYQLDEVRNEARWQQQFDSYVDLECVHRNGLACERCERNESCKATELEVWRTRIRSPRFVKLQNGN